MCPFPQSVTYSRASPAVFPSPPGIIEAAFVNFGGPKYLQWLVQWCPMSKSVLLSYINSADVMRVKRESKNT